MNKPIRILIADDHALMRAGLRALLMETGGCDIVGEAADGIEAARLIRQLAPEVALVDLTMPGMNGLDVIASASRDAPATRCLALSMHTAEHYVLEALRAGAAGYVVKDSAPDELHQALKVVAAGGQYLSPAVSGHVLADYLRLVRERAEGEGAGEVLTSRQRQILQLIAEGHSTREIAGRLSISVKTVETHRAQLMDRLDIHDVAGLTRYAIRAGLIQADS